MQELSRPLLGLLAGHEKVMDLVFDEFEPDRGFVLLGSDATGPLDAAVVRYRERPKTVDEGRIPVSRTIITHTLEKGQHDPHDTKG